MNIYKIDSFRGALSDYEDKGTPGSFKFGSNLDVRKITDSLSCNQDLMEIGTVLQSSSSSKSPSASTSPSSSRSPSLSPSISPSSSVSPSIGSHSASVSPSSSKSPSSSASPSASVSPSHSVSPSPSPSGGLKTKFSDLIHFFVKCSDGSTYGFGNTGKVYKINSDFSVFQVYDLRKPIIGAAEWYNSSSKTYLYFATDKELHRKEIPGRADWNDVDSHVNQWPKTNLTSSDWHTMRESGGSLLIANSNTLALVGYDDSYTNDAVNFIPGNVSKTLVERSGRTITGTYRSSDPEKGVNAAIDSEVPLAQVGNDGELYYADMSSSISIKRFPGGGEVNPGGVTNETDHVNFFEWEQDALSWINKQAVGNLSLWGVYNATTGKNGIYSYGRKNKNHPMVMNMEYEMDVDEIGAIVNANGIIYASYRDGSDFGVRVVDLNNKAKGTYEGLDFKAPNKTPEKPTTWRLVEAYMAPLPSGCSVEFWYRMNKLGSFVQAKVADNSLSFTTTGAKKAVFQIAVEGDVYEPKFVLNSYQNTCPEIYRIRTYFE